MDTSTTAAPAATQPEAIGLALDVLREMLSDPDQRLDQCPARMARANQAARALAGVQAAPAAQEAEPATGLWQIAENSGTHGWRQGWYVFRESPSGREWLKDEKRRIAHFATRRLAERAVARAAGAWGAAAPRPQADAGAVPAGGLRRIGRIQHDALGHPQAVLETAYDLLGNGWQPGTSIYSDEAAAPQAPAAAADHVAAFWASVEDGTVFDDISPETWHLVDKLVEQLKAAGDTAFIDEAPTPAAALAPAEADDDEEWRRLALQFDGHRMQAIGLLKLINHTLKGGPAFSTEKIQGDIARFLSEPPLSGEEVLAERIARAAAPTQEADGWMPIETAPKDGRALLLGPRHAPVVGMVSHPMPWDERQEPAVSVVHYNGNRLVAGYRCSEWHRLPDARARQEGGGA